jgi:hypothetical protein
MAGIIQPPNTVAQLSHAVTIRANGQTVGAINEWSPRHTRAVTELYELADGTTGGFAPGVGVPFEKVPGNISGMTVEVRRYDIYPQQMEQAFTVADLTMLSNQNDPFECRETWTTPNNANGYFNRYQGCWFSDLGRTLSATADRVINVNATLQWTRRERGSI